MPIQAPIRHRLTDRSTPAFAQASALLLLGFSTAAPVAAQSAPKAHLEQRVTDTAKMLEDHPHFKGRAAQEIEKGVEFVTGNTVFVLSHESGHALIAEMGIPVIGREEDGADAFATIMALKMKNAFADRVLTSAARGWFLGDQRDKKDGMKTPYYDEHGIDLERAYAIVCLMVGGEPDKYSPLADEVKIPAERQGTCQGDYSNASWSWDKVLKPHQRTPEQPKTKIDVTYGPGGEYESFAEMARKLRILEGVAEHLSESYVWRTPSGLEMQVCGEPAAHWDLSTRKITVCYEIIWEFSQLYRHYGHLELVPELDKKVLAKKRR